MQMHNVIFHHGKVTISIHTIRAEQNQTVSLNISRRTADKVLCLRLVLCVLKKDVSKSERLKIHTHQAKAFSLMKKQDLQ
jgi:hypothetical protein